jgi:hypothetical protein
MSSRIDLKVAEKSPVILQRQVESVERLAMRVGVSRQALEAQTSYNKCKSIDRTIDQTQRVVDAFGSFAGFSFADLKNELERTKGRDFWDYIAVQERATHWLAVASIADIAAQLPIEWSSLLKIAKRHQLPKPASDRESMIKFLQAIPSAYIFDHEFNAFIEWNIEDLPPCIFYDTLLLNCLSDLALILSVYWEAKASEIKDSYKADDITRIFTQAELTVDKLLGRKLLDQGRTLEERIPGAVTGGLGMIIASQLFVSCHEIAHLLLGHLDKEPDQGLEYEADAFSTLIVGSSRWPNKEFGIAAVFALIDVIEGDRSFDNKSHPSSLNRLRFIAKQTEVMRANTDWDYVITVLKCVLDSAAQARIGRRIFEAAI